MKKSLKYSVGVDMSKEKFDACISIIDIEQKVTIKATKQFNNTEKGIKAFIEWEAKHVKFILPVVFTMEATGIYYEKLALALYEAGKSVSVILPNKAKKYMQSLGYKSKTDKIDAKGLARMGAEQHLKRWMPFSENIYKLRLLTRQNEDLQKQRTVLINRNEACQFSQYESEVINQQITSMLELIDKQIQEVKKEIIKVIEQDETLKERVYKIDKIKGLGILTIATIIAETNGFYLFKNQRQLVSYAGYDVIENQSGKRVGKTRMSKKGNSHIRRALHLPAFNVVRHDQGTFRALYERVYKKTNFKMKGYVAVQRKLLMLIYTLWKNYEDFNPDYHITSGNDEPKLLFSPGFKEAKKIPAVEAGIQDELPCKESPEVLFSPTQN